MTENCCTALGMTLGEVGAYDEGLPYQERAWEISVELYGPEDRYTLQRRSDMARLLEGKRDRVRARAMYEEVLEAQERRLGREDLDVAATLNNLGASFARDDLYHETLRCYLGALRIRGGVWERTGPNDPNRRENAYKVAESHSNIGALLMDLGRHGEAGPHLASALEILADEVELAHERNAGTLVIVGRALRAQRDYQGSVEHRECPNDIHEHRQNLLRGCCLDASKCWSRVQGVGGGRPDTVRSTASADPRSGQRLAAGGTERIRTDVRRRSPHDGGILRILAGVCDAQGHSEDGRRYRERAEANCQKNFQGEDANAASALNAHGTSLTGQGLYDEAHAYLECALRIREQVLGERDFDTSTSLLKLGILFQLWGRDAQARPYLERALAVHAGVCGEDYPATDLVRENLRLLDI